jgi:hypothetical protein
LHIAAGITVRGALRRRSRPRRRGEREARARGAAETRGAPACPIAAHAFPVPKTLLTLAGDRHRQAAADSAAGLSSPPSTNSVVRAAARKGTMNLSRYGCPAHASFAYSSGRIEARRAAADRAGRIGFLPFRPAVLRRFWDGHASPISSLTSFPAQLFPRARTSTGRRAQLSLQAYPAHRERQGSGGLLASAARAADRPPRSVDWWLMAGAGLF